MHYMSQGNTHQTGDTNGIISQALFYYAGTAQWSSTCRKCHVYSWTTRSKFLLGSRILATLWCQPVQQGGISSFSYLSKHTLSSSFFHTEIGHAQTKTFSHIKAIQAQPWFGASTRKRKERTTTEEIQWWAGWRSLYNEHGQRRGQTHRDSRNVHDSQWIQRVLFALPSSMASNRLEIKQAACTQRCGEVIVYIIHSTQLEVWPSKASVRYKSSGRIEGGCEWISSLATESPSYFGGCYLYGTEAVSRMAKELGFLCCLKSSTWNKTCILCLSSTQAHVLWQHILAGTMCGI